MIAFPLSALWHRGIRQSSDKHSLIFASSTRTSYELLPNHETLSRRSQRPANRSKLSLVYTPYREGVHTRDLDDNISEVSALPEMILRITHHDAQ